MTTVLVSRDSAPMAWLSHWGMKLIVRLTSVLGVCLTAGLALATETLKMDQLPLGEQVTLTSGTKITMIRAGSGEVPGKDVKLLIHYKLTMNGKETDNSKKRIIPNPLEVELGVTPLVPGFAAALEGMRVGEIRQVVVPPDQGYGEGGNKLVGVPPGTTLYFELELVGTRKKAPKVEGEH